MSEKDEVEILLDKGVATGEDNVQQDEESPNSAEAIGDSDRPDSRKVYQWLKDHYKKTRLPNKYRLVSDDDVLRNSISSVRLTVMCSAINTKLLNPNYPIMATPGAHPDSFDNTKPFEFNSATYFLPMCSLLGVAVASVFLGQISDRVGRKKVLLILAWISSAGSIVKYFTSNTFWSFCISQMVFGIFLGNLPVGMAYIGDVCTRKVEKESELGILVSCFVIGNSGGGILAILMNGSGLFAPLLVASGMLAIAAITTSCYMVEAADLPKDKVLVAFNQHNDDHEKEIARPETIDKKALWNIVGGAIADNIGSTGLFPLCLSPLALEQYLVDFTSQDPPEDPIMSITGYQWLSVCVAFMVVPSTMITPAAFRKFGVAGTCVLGNLMTAFVTLALLLIGNAAATAGWFATFVSIMYAGFPFTVFSQLTTGPMLDLIAPIDKIGYVQGLNNAAMNFGMAVAPWVFGLLADSAGTNIAIGIGIGTSCLAAAINAPLSCDSRFGRQKKLPPSSGRVLSGEDSHFIEMALAGDPVDPEALVLANLDRVRTGKAAIIPAVKPYRDEKDELEDLHKLAGANFEFRMNFMDEMLAALDDPTREKTKEEMCQMLNLSLLSDKGSMTNASNDLGAWIADYLRDAGYNPHTTSPLIKQMILTALPAICFEDEYTPENIEGVILRTRHVYSKFHEMHSEEKENQWHLKDTLGKGSSAVFYS